MNDQKTCPNCEKLKLELQKAEQEIHRQKRLKRIERNKVKRLSVELERLKAVDAVPVVRCRDCKNGKTWKNGFGVEGFKCELLCVDLSPEAFCSYGQRRCDNEHP